MADPPETIIDYILICVTVCTASRSEIRLLLSSSLFFIHDLDQQHTGRLALTIATAEARTS